MKLLINTYSVLWLLLAVVFSDGISQISTKDSIVYTTEVTVKFKSEAFYLIEPDGLADLVKMRTELTALRSYFAKHGEVRFRKVFSDAIWGDTLRTNKLGETVVVPDLSQIYRVIFPKPVKMWETVYKLRELPDIEFADPPTFAVHDLTPNDIHGHGNQWNLTKVNATSAWDITTGSSSIKVAVIDNGVDASHTDLSGKLTAGESGYSGGANNHGTKVAGVVGAATNNGIGIASLGWNIMVMPFNKDNGSGLAADIRTAVDGGAHVLNCSWRIVTVDPNDNSKYINYDDWSIRDAIQYAVSRERVVVASAGNPPGPITFPDGVTRNPSEYPPFLQYPAANPGVIAVSATNSSDQFPSGYNYGSHVDVSAPSISILTTVVGNTYSTFDGTSFGAPLVSALAGLILSMNPNLSISKVTYIIETSADDLGTQGRDDYYGYGRINANKAVRNLYVPQVYSTISSAISAAITGQTVVVSGGTYTENLAMKAGVTVTGSGPSSTTINGTVTFSSADYSSLKNAAVNGKISVNNSSSVVIDNVKANNSNCYIDAYGSSVTIDDFISEVSQTRGLYAHNGSSCYVDNSSFRNKYDGQHYEDTSYGENLVVVFCQNQTYDIVAFNNAYVENYWCSYSSPTEGSTVYGEVIWYTWNFCGMYKMAADAERRLMFKTNEEELGYAEFKRAMAQYKTVRDKIRIDRKEGKTNAVENHTIELLESVTRFKEFIDKYRGSKYSGIVLCQISTIYGLLRADEELISYMKGIALDKELAHLRAEAYNNILTMYFKREENQKAVELSEQLIKEYPNHPLVVEWHYGQGLMYKYKMNDVVRAEEIFREVVEKYPAHGTAISAREHLGIRENAIAKEQALSSSVERELTILNYPNPFNPTTKIKYSIPETGLVVIKVYDMLGKEIETFILHS